MCIRRMFLALLCGAAPVLADTFRFELDVKIRYDVVADGVVLPDTVVWGMPDGIGLPSGTLQLSIDDAGNVSGATLLHPVAGLGMLYGGRQYELHNSTLLIEGGSWGAPVANVAPITGASVSLGDTFFGDFGGLTQVTGFIQDGNSGDFFHLTNGLGPDGKVELIATGPSGMSVTFTAKSYTGAGIGWYTIGVDGGDMAYSVGADTASVGITGVVSYNLWLDPVTRTFFMPEQILLENHPADWWQLGRRLDSFAGSIDSSGSFTGSAHLAGIEFSSLDFTGSGSFADGNSPGFDASNGLAPGDGFTAILTDQTGKADLVVTGTLVAQTWTDLGQGLAGASDVPVLAGNGILVAGELVALTLSGALPNEPATLVIGLSQLDLPFQGGTLVPSPDFLIAGMTTDNHGGLLLSSTWSSGIAADTTLTFQFWLQDAGGPRGFSASNGLAATTFELP